LKCVITRFTNPPNGHGMPPDRESEELISLFLVCVTETAGRSPMPITSTAVLVQQVSTKAPHNEPATITIRPDATRIRWKPHRLNYSDQYLKLS